MLELAGAHIRSAAAVHEVGRLKGDPSALRQDHLRLEPEELAVASSGFLEGLGLGGFQIPVRLQVEPDLIAADCASHRGDELSVGQCHSRSGLASTRNYSSGVQNPAGVLIAAVDLVE